MMGGRCSRASPEREYERSAASMGIIRAGREAPSPSRVTKTLQFMSSDSEDGGGSSADEQLAAPSSSTARQRCASDDSNKENGATGGEFRHRVRRAERLQEYAASPARRRRARSPSKERRFALDGASPPRSRSPPCHCMPPGSPPSSWNSPSVVLTTKLGLNLTMKTPPPVTPAKTRTRTTPGKTRRSDLSGRKLLLKLSVPGSPCPQLPSADTLDTLTWLGAGVSSDAFKARLGPEDMCYAIKKSKFELRNDRERSLLLKEIKILQPLESSETNFEHLVRYYQAWQENGFFCLLLELCEGGTLKDFLSGHEDVPETLVWYILHQVAAGLVVLHAHDIVHLDIKPDNIFITKAGSLKVGDLGMATEVVSDSSARNDEPEGDAAYMAPELLSSSHRLPSADIFCLGITMLEMTRKSPLPVDGDEWHRLRQGKLPRLPSKYSTRLQSLVEEMMHPDATQRPSASTIAQEASTSFNATTAVAVFKEYVRVRSAAAAATPETRGNTRRSLQMSAQTPRKRRTSVP